MVTKCQIFSPVNYSFFTVNIHSNIGQTNSSSFSSQNFVNSEPIDQNLNGKFANKYSKI